MELVNCSKKYWNFVRMLRTDPKLIKFFLDQSPITKSQQYIYMEKYNKFFMICLENKVPLGYIGLIGEKKNEITLCVSSEHQNRGVGKFMLSSFVKINSKQLFSKVKRSNKSSNLLFLKSGFKKINQDNLFNYYSNYYEK